MFLETWVFLGGPVCWHITVHSFLLWFFCVSVVPVVISPLSFLTGFSLLSSRWVWWEAYGLSFQKTSSCCIDLFCCFWIFILFISSLILLAPSFCWLWVLSVLFFLILLGVRLDYLRFFFFLEKGLYGYELLELFLLHPIDFRKLCFHFLLSWGIFWFPLWFPCLFSGLLFSVHVFILFPFFLLWLISSFILLWSEKMLKIISILNKDFENDCLNFSFNTF